MVPVSKKSWLFGLGILFGVSAFASPDRVPGEFLVKLKPQFDVQQYNTTTLQSGVTVKEVLKKGNLLLVKVEDSAQSLSTVFSERYEYIEPNYIYTINREVKTADQSVTPDDPQLGNLWGMINTGQKDSSSKSGVAGIDINALKAWSVQTGSKDVVVAVIDTGIDPTHPDLADNMWVNEAELNGEEGVDDDGNGYIDDIHGYNFAGDSGKLIDDNGHGSHCAGTIGAKGNNGVGVVGVSWNVSLMGLKFLTGSGGGTLANAIKAIDYATDNGANIMSNSWGGGGFSQALLDSIQRASDKGILFIAAAGNSRQDNDRRPTYPANYETPNMVSVAAIDNTGRLANFSSYGKTTVHVAAPGVNVLSSTPRGYESYSGTSMAAPHVSGVAALVAAQYPGISMLEMRDRIINTAKPSDLLAGKVLTGMVDAHAALTFDGQTPPSDPDQGEEEPVTWSEKQISDVASSNPYESDTDQRFEILQPGAKRFKIYFERFRTEADFDSLTIYDKNGNLVAEMTGDLGRGFWSPVIEGDSAVLNFVTDDSINDWGFLVSKISYQE